MSSIGAVWHDYVGVVGAEALLVSARRQQTPNLQQALQALSRSEMKCFA